MFEVTIPSPQARYPDRIAASAPRGLRQQVAQAASIEKITAADFIRQAVAERVALVLGCQNRRAV